MAFPGAGAGALVQYCTALLLVGIFVGANCGGNGGMLLSTLRDGGALLLGGPCGMATWFDIAIGRWVG